MHFFSFRVYSVIWCAEKARSEFPIGALNVGCTKWAKKTVAITLRNKYYRSSVDVTERHINPYMPLKQIVLGLLDVLFYHVDVHRESRYNLYANNTQWDYNYVGFQLSCEKYVSCGIFAEIYEMNWLKRSLYIINDFMCNLILWHFILFTDYIYIWWH